MRDYTQDFLELILLAATDLPPDVEASLVAAREREASGSAAQGALDTILKLEACKEVPGVYLHAIGGAATLIAQAVKQVLGVYKLDFGVPEALWVLEVKDFPAVVTMDSHGNSLHAEIEAKSRAALEALIAG